LDLRDFNRVVYRNIVPNTVVVAVVAAVQVSRAAAAAAAATRFCAYEEWGN